MWLYWLRQSTWANAGWGNKYEISGLVWTIGEEILEKSSLYIHGFRKSQMGQTENKCNTQKQFEQVGSTDYHKIEFIQVICKSYNHIIHIHVRLILLSTHGTHRYAIECTKMSKSCQNNFASWYVLVLYICNQFLQKNDFWGIFLTWPPVSSFWPFKRVKRLQNAS